MGGIGGNAVAAGLVVSGFAIGETYLASGVQRRGPNWALVGAGAGVSVASMIVAELLWPRRADLIDFANKYNRLRPTVPMQLELGVTASPDRVARAATLTF
jgi:hypothetical protein